MRLKMSGVLIIHKLFWLLLPFGLFCKMFVATSELHCLN